MSITSIGASDFEKGVSGAGVGVSPLVVRPNAACVMLSCSRPTLYNLINANEIESFKEAQHGRRLITVASIHSYIARGLAGARAAATQAA
jgi:hypothetical protein